VRRSSFLRNARERSATFARPVLLAMAGGVLALLAESACESRPIHVFGGYAFDPTHDCLDPACAVDVVAGADPGPCPTIRCWLSSGGIAYVTTTACDAPPDYVDETHNPSSTLCVKALAEYTDAGPTICPASDIGGGGAGGGCY
jgi:hypothetical protein